MSEEKPWRDEQQLRELYVDEGLSTREIGNKLQCSPKTVETWIDIDLLLRLKAEESDHRIRAVVALRFQPALGGNRRHTGGTLVCLPRRAVARPMRPHRTPCHRRANHRRFATPCGSGTASHRVRSIRANGGHKHESTDKRAKCPLDPRLKTEICARNLYHALKPEAKPWWDERQLRKLRDEGLSEEKIAERLDCSQTTIHNWLVKYNLDTSRIKPDHPWHDEEVLRLLYVKQGLIMTEVAGALDCSREAVEDWIHRHNIETRSRTPETPELLKNCQKLEQLYHDRGMSTYAIPEQLDCAPSAVYNWFRRHDTETRSVGSQPGELHHRWKGGDEPYYGANWTEQRRKALERDGNQCSKCGITAEEHEKSTGIGLDVHRRTPIRTFDDPEDANTLDNLVTLCRACHNQIEPPQSITHE